MTLGIVRAITAAQRRISARKPILNPHRRLKTFYAISYPSMTRTTRKALSSMDYIWTPGATST